MKEYPMLDQIDEDRVTKIGGKAAILEEIAKRWPNAPIPKFKVFDKKKPKIGMFEKTPRVFRASSDLDLFGGFGLHETCKHVYNSNYSKEADKIFHPEWWKESRLNMFSQSIGRNVNTPTIMSQEQGDPDFWAVIMQHPNNPDIYLVNYSNFPTRELIVSPIMGTTEINIRLKVAETYTAYAGLENNIEGRIKRKEDKNLIKKAIEAHLKIQDLNIVSNSWASILEAGFYKDRIEIYQFTPTREKTNTKHDIKKETLIMGTCDAITLPLVEMPVYVVIQEHIKRMYYTENLYPLDGYPEFNENIIRIKKKVGLLNFPEIYFWDYMKLMDLKHPEGYIVIEDSDPYRCYDISMTKAKAVLINDPQDNPLRLLNHNISRIIHKAPVLIIDSIVKDYEIKDKVNFSCDGSSYTLEPGT